MKSIYTKINVILIFSFLLQVILIGSLFRFVIAREVIADINKHEEARQIILQDAVAKMEKLLYEPERAQKFLDRWSEKYDVDFEVRDMEGVEVMHTSFPKISGRIVKETGFIKIKKKEYYIIYAYFPANIKNISSPIQGSRTKLIIIFVTFLISFLTSFLIYNILALPLKKLRKAMDSIEYGNTLIKIPYYSNDEIGILCRRFEEMGGRLKKSENNQTELIQAISHDLKTPLTSIIGYITRLIDGKAIENNKRDEYYDIIYRKANDLKHLLEELEDFANIDSSARYEMQQVDCNAFFKDMCDELKSDILQREGQFEYFNRVDGSYKIEFDESKIRRVFANIIGNSFKYAGENVKITIASSKKDDFILYEICDNGKGVPEDQLDKIFNRFYRLDTSRSRDKEGTGLGLAICKNIIKIHGGDIGARANPEGGLCIWFTLPIK